MISAIVEQNIIYGLPNKIETFIGVNNTFNIVKYIINKRKISNITIHSSSSGFTTCIKLPPDIMIIDNPDFNFF